MPNKDSVGSHATQFEDTVDVTISLRPRRPKGSPDAWTVSPADLPGPRIPRIARLMALAIKFQDMVDRGDVRDYADLARLGYVSRARLTQIMNLRHLAPDIQTNLLREVSRIVFWADQRRVLSQIDGPVPNGFVRTKNGKKARKKASVMAERHRP